MRPTPTDLFMDTSPESRVRNDEDIEDEEEDDENEEYGRVEYTDDPVETLFDSQDVREHLDEIIGMEDGGAFVTIPQLNYSIPWKTVQDVEENELAKFTPEHTGELFSADTQVSALSFSCQHDRDIFESVKFIMTS